MGNEHEARIALCRANSTGEVTPSKTQPFEARGGYGQFKEITTSVRRTKIP